MKDSNAARMLPWPSNRLCCHWRFSGQSSCHRASGLLIPCAMSARSESSCEIEAQGDILQFRVIMAGAEI